MTSITHHPWDPKWEGRIAYYRPITRAAMLDKPVLLAVTDDVFQRLTDLLTQAIAYPLGRVEVSVIEADHAGYFTRGLEVMVFAEVRVLVLKHPNPMPELELFPRVTSAVKRFRRMSPRRP